MGRLSVYLWLQKWASSRRLLSSQKAALSYGEAALTYLVCLVLQARRPIVLVSYSMSPLVLMFSKQHYLAYFWWFNSPGQVRYLALECQATVSAHPPKAVAEA